MQNNPSSRFSIAVIEDNGDLNSLIVRSVRSEGYDAQGVSSVEDFDRLILERQPDLFILDLNLPGEDGTSFSLRMRAARPTVGIIMLTARDELDDRSNGYRSGADIYLTKPSSIDELLNAIAALTRRLDRAEPVADRTAGGIKLDLRRLELIAPTGRVRLSPEEADLLAMAATRPDGRISLDDIRQALKRGDDLSKSAIEIKIFRLRKKFVEIGIGERAISNIRGMGYQLTLPCTVEAG